MTIFWNKLDDIEKRTHSLLSEHAQEMDRMYEDLFLCLSHKDEIPLLKRCKERRDNARERLNKFDEYLIINGKAVNV